MLIKSFSNDTDVMTSQLTSTKTRRCVCDLSATRSYRVFGVKKIFTEESYKIYFIMFWKHPIK